ncbi:MAG: amidohydrolase family protein [Microbacteriaceae bacterium]|nr:amidohydrolase family protein [Microbacteriaceae bacterium]
MALPETRTATAIDLSGVSVIDNHCHPIETIQPSTRDDWRACFSESPDAEMRSIGVADTVFYRRMLGASATFHGIDAADPEAEALVLAARASLSSVELTAQLFRDATIGGVVLDTGYPAANLVIATPSLTAATGTNTVVLARLELHFQDLIAVHADFDELIAAVRHFVDTARTDGWAGFKSIAAYRTGLAIERWSPDASQTSFAAARAEVAATGSVRLGHKPLLDTLLHLAFAAAAAQELPVQFHVGYGDPDVDLRAASPLELRAIFEDPAYRAMPVVLLHGCWPYVREGAYLASVYGNAYLDLSYGIPFLSIGEMTAVTRAALGVAPLGKLMYSSDGARVPELHWLGAHDGRRILGATLGELVAAGELSRADAETAGERILNSTAGALYGLCGVRE